MALLRARRRAFSLIELMIALAIGLFVVAALYNLFTAQVRAFVYQDLQMEMHQSTRLTLDMVGRSARLAGLGTNGTTVGAFGSGGDANNALPAIIASNGSGPNGSDAVTFVTMDPSLLMNTGPTAAPSCATSLLTFEPAELHNAARLAQYHANELIMCYDYASIGGFRSFLWPITADGNAVSGEIEVTSASGYGDYESVCNATDNLPRRMPCSRAEVVTFYIDADDTDGYGAGSEEHPVLMMDLDLESPDDDDVPLVDNVEDLQIAYCLQSAVGGTDCSSDPWLDTIATDQADEVYMIRISIVVRSSREDLARLHPGLRPALEDNGVGTTTDHYFRQVLSTEVTVRNMRIQAQL